MYMHPALPAILHTSVLCAHDPASVPPFLCVPITRTTYVPSFILLELYSQRSLACRSPGVLFWSRKEQIQCAVSTASVLAFVYVLVVMLFDFAWTAILVRHFVPVLIMNYWLVMVTYLQHHEEDTKVREKIILRTKKEVIVVNFFPLSSAIIRILEFFCRLSIGVF